MKIMTLIRWLSLISLILLVVLFLPQFIREGNIPGFSSTSNQLLQISADSVTAVSIITTPNEITSFTRTGDHWQVNGQSADTTAVQRLLDSLVDIQINSVAARNPDNYVQLGISSESARLVVVTSEGKDQTIEVGKPGVTLNTFYSKKVDQAEVFLVKGSLLNVLSYPASSYIATDSGKQSDVAAASAAATLSPGQ